MNKPVYYLNSIVSEDDVPNICERFKIPFDIVAETIAKLQQGIDIPVTDFKGAVRHRLETMLQYVTIEPEMEDNDPGELTGSVVISGDAANKLINALVDPTHDNFIIFDGICTINPNNPPSIEHSYQVVADVLKLRDLGDTIDDKTSWLLGSIVDQLENFHGENFEIGQVCNQTTRSYNTIWTSREVYKAFKDKRYNVSFTHHKEVFFAKISDDAKKLILHKAESYKLTCGHVRNLCSITKTMDGDTTVIANIKSKNQAEDLILAYKNNKVTYIIFNDNTWLCKKGTMAEAPTGTLVINLKNMTQSTQGKPFEEIEMFGKKKK